MKNQSFLKTSHTSIETLIDKDTGEIFEISVNKTTYLANSKEEFFLMYASLLPLLKKSHDVKIKLFASLLGRYKEGQEFALPKYLKEVIAKETDCSARSLEKALTELIEVNIIVRLSAQMYIINPRHVFKGSSGTRNKALKAIIELGCKEC